MDVSEFDFDLPKALIALRPACPRDSARMLVVSPHGELLHSSVSELPTFLRSGDLVVVNDTRVFNARLRGRRIGRGETEPKIEVMLHTGLGSNSYGAFAKPARKLLTGDRLALGSTLTAAVVQKGERGEVVIKFDQEDVEARLPTEGEIPLPPYIASVRSADAKDAVDYQTIFASQQGSVAAPTAGLHFTPSLLERLAAAGVGHDSVTLHVGAGTFQPVSAAKTEEHQMHSEYARLSAATADRLNAVHRAQGRVVAVGTTSVRTLETAADNSGVVHPWNGETNIFIEPGFRFHAVDILLTNFHLPRSTLLMLVSAFCGTDRIKAAYAEAIKNKYRFYSYGDACLLFRPHDEVPV